MSDYILCIMVCPECKTDIEITPKFLLSPPNLCPGCGLDMTPDEPIPSSLNGGVRTQ